MNSKATGLVPWLLSAALIVISIAMWAQPMQWQLGGLSAYRLFPLFGLLAFSLMWAHYASGFLKRTLGVRPAGPYLKVTSYLVLTAILLHPGILVYQLWRDGLGLPPVSTLNYVAPTMQGAIVFGMVALLAFLSFDLHRWFRERSW